MNYKVLCVVLSAAAAMSVASCGKKAPAVAGNYEGAVPIIGENKSLGIKEFESSLPVYLSIGRDNTFQIDLGFRELKKDLNGVIKDIERDGVYTVKDITVSGTDHYEGTYEYKDGRFVFTGDIDFTMTYEDDVLQAENLFGEKTIKFD